MCTQRTVHNWVTASQHLEYRHLTSGRNNLPDCQNFGRLRWLLYYFCTYRQFRGKFKSAAFPKTHFLVDKVRKKCSECTVVATHRTRDVCSSPQQRHSSISSTSLTNLITQQGTLRTTAYQSGARGPHDTRTGQKSFLGVQRIKTDLLHVSWNLKLVRHSVKVTQNIRQRRRKKWRTVQFQTVWSL